MALVPFLTWRPTLCHCRYPRASHVPSIVIIRRLPRLHLSLGEPVGSRYDFTSMSGSRLDANSSAMRDSWSFARSALLGYWFFAAPSAPAPPLRASSLVGLLG